MRRPRCTKLSFIGCRWLTLLISVLIMLGTMLRLPCYHSFVPRRAYSHRLRSLGRTSVSSAASASVRGHRVTGRVVAAATTSFSALVPQSRLSATAGNNKVSTRLGKDSNNPSDPEPATGDDDASSAVVKPYFESDTVAGLLAESMERLETQHVPEPQESAINLLAAALQLDWETGHRQVRQVYQQPAASATLAERVLTTPERDEFTAAIARRLRYEPIQYILGKWDFWDHVFEIQSPLLCPRPETEELVGLVVGELRNFKDSSLDSAAAKRRRRILDVGCGTGCIGVSLAAETGLHVKVSAIDVEPVAIEVASRNAANILGSDWKERYSAVLEPAADYSVTTDTDRFELVVSNPPYIPATDEPTLTADVVEYESKTALISGTDGLDVIRTIVHQLPAWCIEGATCWMEVDPTHPALLREWLGSEGSELGVEYCGDFQDMYGRDRFVKLRVVETR